MPTFQEVIAANQRAKDSSVTSKEITRPEDIVSNIPSREVLGEQERDVLSFSPSRFEDRLKTRLQERFDAKFRPLEEKRAEASARLESTFFDPSGTRSADVAEREALLKEINLIDKKMSINTDRMNDLVKNMTNQAVEEQNISLAKIQSLMKERKELAEEKRDSEADAFNKLITKTKLSLEIPEGKSVPFGSETITGLAPIDKSANFKTVINPITQEQMLYNVQTGEFVRAPQAEGGVFVSGKPGVAIAEYSQIFMGSPLNAEGVDFAGKPNSPIKTRVSGEVVFAGSAGGWGNQVKIKDSKGNIHQFSHLNGINVGVGDQIETGQIIGLMGNTGNVLKADGTKPSEEELVTGRGTHLDYTVYRPDGTKYTVQEAANFAGIGQTGGDKTVSLLGKNEAEVLSLGQSLGYDITNEKDRKFLFDARQRGLSIPRAGTDKDITETQRLSANFANRMSKSNEIMDEQSNQIKNAGNLKFTYLRSLPMGSGPAALLANNLKPEWYQKIEQAERDFLNALLRRESGAVISDEEFDSGAAQYFPMPGDSQAVIIQKKENRKTALEGMKFMSGDLASEKFLNKQSKELSSVNISDEDRQFYNNL